MVTTILWPAILNAILPMSLREIIRLLPEIAERLARLAGGAARKVAGYRARYQSTCECDSY
jgi:hypothetical protein